jgi:hypothetical protein
MARIRLATGNRLRCNGKINVIKRNGNKHSIVGLASRLRVGHSRNHDSIHSSGNVKQIFLFHCVLS